MTRLSSWRLALRLARREATRARGRSVLAIVMIALPVLAVTAADVLIQTQNISAVESLDRRLGTATAQVQVPAQGSPMVQDVDPAYASSTVGKPPEIAPTAKDIASALGNVRLLEQATGGVELRTDAGVGWVEALEVDLADPLADGLVRLISGRLPEGADEVVVNEALLDKGYVVGDRLDLRGKDAPAPVIVGIAESAEIRSAPFAAGAVGSIGLTERGWYGPTWLVGGGPIDWETVRELNDMGAIVLSRAVVEDPPPRSEIPEEINAWYGDGTDEAVIAVVALIVSMALLEVVLLAGPAFAVGARRQARSLALMAASGGTPAQSRRVVLANGLVLGGVAAVVGVVAGVAAGIALRPVLQRWSSSWFGPLDIPWTHVLGVAGLGLLSALLATLVPAWIASRQDVVAVLAGRRADRRPSVRSPILGVVLLGLGMAGAAYGATAAQSGEFFIAGSAVLAILGMILLLPMVVVLVAKLAAPLPLSGRYAARDAARHRTRTVPAIAAVAATVAGVVTLGIAVSSDEAENEGTYVPALAMGQAAVTGYDLRPAKWDQLADAVRGVVPDAELEAIIGTDETGPRVRLVDPDRRGPLLESMSVNFGSSMLVTSSIPSAVPGLSAADRARADEVLAGGGVVAFADDPVDDDTATIRLGREQATVPAAYLRFADGPFAPLAAVLSPQAADQVGAPTQTVALAVTGTELSSTRAEDVAEAVAANAANASFYVERGYQAEDETVIIQLVLAALGAALMLGGTLTATFLALSDAKPDLATLSAVGASPRRRRGIAAAYALVVGFVGAVLGAVVGFIPGIAITYPLTASAYSETGPFLDIPWLLIGGLVIGLPLLTAATVGVCTRSRLPLVARLD
ncbi:MAG: ABC transporter permease [Nocardioides sp.]